MSKNILCVKNLCKIYKSNYSDSQVFFDFIAQKSNLTQISSFNEEKDFVALEDINFELKSGESLAIVGRNGAGKSTLLQILAGTLQQTSGTYYVNGSLGALLELGAGIHPEFSGRENIYLLGAVYHLSKQEIKSKLDSIIAFSDLGDFIDKPVKTYSSGMFLRLAFSIQISLEPDILIIDEALAVGDIHFQAKCVARIKELQFNGTSLIFVSHSLDAAKTLCSKGLYLSNGKMELFGSVDDACDAYMGECIELDVAEKTSPSSNQQNIKAITIDNSYISRLLPPFTQRISARYGEGHATYTECCFFSNNREIDTIQHGDQMTVYARLYCVSKLPANAEIGLVVRTLYGLDLFAVNSHFLGTNTPCCERGTSLHLHFKFPVLLGPGNYTIALGLRVPTQGSYWDKVYNAGVFNVLNNPETPIHTLFRNSGQIEISDSNNTTVNRS